ncbi:MAG: APC family permease, partial [Candidatus Woesearchaeota archaeon]
MVGFHKVLDYRVILIITINSILGSGLFLYPAMGALYAGPSSILSWIILSIVVVYISMLFAEMVSMYPKAGGVYEFCKQAYGPFWGFVVGWMAWIIGNMMVALLLVGAVQYLIPSVSLMAFAIKAGISIAWLLIFNWLAYRGTQTSVFMLVLFSVITIIVTLSLIIPGLFFADPSNLQPFFIHEGLVNIWMILLALFFIHGAFFGLEAVMFLSEETKRPEKELPKALMHGTLVTAALTILLVIVSMSVLDHSEFADAAAPFTYMAGSMLGGGFQAFIMVGIYFALVGAAALWVVTGPRLIVALTRDRMFPPKFGAMHPVYNSPSKAIVFQLIVTSALVLLALVGGYDTL